MPSIIIAADICPIGDNLPLFEKGAAGELLNDLLPEIKSADLAIANLECPLIDRPSPIRKTGPVFSAPSASINAIKAAGFKALCLANNHIMDHGGAGLANTQRVCAEAGIKTVGAGANRAEARRLVFLNLGGLRIGILAVAEHEFSIATETSPGANPLDLIDFVRNVRANQESFDYLLVLLHGSAEFHVPTPRTQEVCRFMIEMGANAVIVQHPHCLGGIEQYVGGHMVYGQGALLMDEALYRDLDTFHEGFLVKLHVTVPRQASLELIPFTQSAGTIGARRLSPEAQKDFLLALRKKSSELSDPVKVQERWREFCRANRHSYLSALLGHGRFLSKLNSRGLLTKYFYGDLPLLRAKNVLSCETHREAVQTIFEHELNS